MQKEKEGIAEGETKSDEDKNTERGNLFLPVSRP
jgi:hypothetical protein